MDNTKLSETIISKIKGSVTLDFAVELMKKIEAYASEKGLPCVIAIDNAHGNPIAVHAMDGSYLVSYEVATQKAYTAVAVKMSTGELGKLAQPGGTFFGLESLQNGKMICFAGGVPLKIGDTVVGGLGISGGTGEQDSDIAAFGLRAFNEMTGQA